MKGISNPASVRTPLWIGLGGAALAVLATAINPLLGTQANEKLHLFITETTKYLVFASAFFVLFWVVLARPLQTRKISRKRWPKLNQVVREAIYSTCTQVIFIAVQIWIAFLIPASAKNSYADISEHGWPYYLATVFAAFVLHDTYFYWMHRLLHHPKLFRRFHAVHHESTDPTPYSAFHFHPVEALLEGAADFAMLAIFLTIPWHVSLPIVWGLGVITLNVIGHLGYEIYPSWWHRVPFLKFKTTGLHHYMHHQRVRGNYALYFRWWDRMCGTEFPDFETRYSALFARKNNAAPGSPVPSE